MAGPEGSVDEKLDERAGFAVGQLPAAAPTIELGAGRTPTVPATIDWHPRRALAFTAAPSFSAARLRSAINSALATELDRGTPFLFIPVFLAAGALVYFAL